MTDFHDVVGDSSVGITITIEGVLGFFPILNMYNLSGICEKKLYNFNMNFSM